MRGKRRITAAAVVVGFLVAAVTPLAASAASTSTSTTSTTVPGVGDAPSFALPTAPAPAGFPKLLMPAKDAPPIPTLDWLTAAQTTGGGVTGKSGSMQQLGATEAAIKRDARVVKIARKRVTGLRQHVAGLHAELADIAQQRLIVLSRERERAIRTYVGGGDNVGVIDLVSLSSPTASARKAVYANAAQLSDADSVDTIDKVARQEHDVLDEITGQLGDATTALVNANAKYAADQAALVTLQSSLTNAFHGGRVFPVDGPFDFYDSWNANRAFASADGSHSHRATDIMAAGGTPVVAIETGFLGRVGWNRLGGWRLWIKGVSGAWYYYAHMSAYAPDLKNGMKVFAGQYLGRVGNTGDAAGGPTHLHFEAHLPATKFTIPSEADKVNPYPLLCLLAGATLPVIPPNETTTTTTTSTTTTTTTLPHR